MFRMILLMLIGFATGAVWAHLNALDPLNPSFIGAGIGLLIFIVWRTFNVFFSSGKKLDLD